MSLVQDLQISPQSGGSTLTPDQKRFNTLLRQVEQVRKTLTLWNDNIPLYMQAHTQVIGPLLTTLTAARRERCFALDRLLHQPGWTKAERTLLRELVCESAAELLASGDQDDPALKALFDKYADVSFDTEQQESRGMLKEMMEAFTGVDLGDASEFDSEQDLFRRFQEKMAARAANADEAAPQAATPPRRKSAAQQRRESEAELATKSVREIFRKLASALHPDRETDPAQRATKTALMQKVNQAYAANDLLTLLELQLQIEQIDADHIANTSAQRLKHYNKILSRQLAELKVEVDRVESAFRFDFGLDDRARMNPTKLVVAIDQNAKLIRAELAQHQNEMRTFADKVAMKRWLKAERQRLQESAYDDMFFF